MQPQVLHSTFDVRWDPSHAQLHQPQQSHKRPRPANACTAVYHSWPQAGNSLQMLPHVLSEPTQRNDVWHALVRPGGVVVVCDYPFVRLVPLKNKHLSALLLKRSEYKV